MIHTCPQDTKNDAPETVLQNYELAFEDLFKGQTALDPAKWNTNYPWGPDLVINQEEQYYVDVLGGMGQQPGYNPFGFNANGLTITPTPIPEGQRPDLTDPSQNGIPGGQRYWSGVMTTRDTFSYKEAYSEICMRPACNTEGAWPAGWWLNTSYYQNAFLKNQAENGGTGDDKFNPEIDWPEFVTGGTNPGTACAKAAYHYFTGDRQDPNNYFIWDLDASDFTQKDGNTGALQSFNNIYERCDGTFSSILPETCDVDYCQDFHTYGIHRVPGDFIHYYLDGELVACVNGFDNIITDQAMYFIINFAVGGAFPYGNPPNQLADPNDYPASLEVEYVRIYTP